MSANMNPNTNPYSASNANMEGTGQTYDPQVFSIEGRIGRLRYLAYSMVSSLVAFLSIGLLVGVVGAATKSEVVTTVGMGILWIAMIAVSIIVSRRRLHDLEHSGWLAILQLVPALNFFFGLYLLFAPGTRGSNRYGAEPGPNNVLVILAACIFPIIVVVGILAAIALPAYSAYTKKARFSEVVLSTKAAKIAVEICAQDVFGGQSGPLPIRGCGAGSNAVPQDIHNATGTVASVVTQDNGVITATASEGNGLHGETYVLIPEYREGRVFWTVEGTCKTASPRIC